MVLHGDARMQNPLPWRFLRKTMDIGRASQSILVVDDEPQVCEVLSDVLLSKGHEVDTAGDGFEALKEMANRRYAIVITDIDMPRMDGMKLIEKIMTDHAGIDVIAITGHTVRYRYTDVVSAGAADFITKPFTLNELEAKLNRIIRERALREQLERLAVRDPLTGLFNRRSFEENARREAMRAIRYQHPLYLFFLDIDHFKEFNDLNGHPSGDALLIETAALLQQSIREDIDSAYRFGGDEFVLLLPHLPEDRVLTVANRIRERYTALGLEPTSLSIGVARFREKSGRPDEDVQDMIQRSDAALYRAKRQGGRDSVHVDESSR